MTATLSVLLDWDDSGAFGTATDDITNRVLAASWSRGRNADYSGEAMGQASLTLRNTDNYFTQRFDPTGTAALIPGRPLWMYATYGGTAYGLFYGRVERVSADPKNRTVTVEAYDPLRQLSEIPVVVASTTIVTRTARDYRIAVLDDAARGSRNMIANPSFETNTTGWAADTAYPATAALSRTSTAYSGTASLQAGGTASWGIYTTPDYAAIAFEDTVYRAVAYARAATGSLTVDFGLGYGASGAAANTSRYALGTAWQRMEITYTPSVTRRPADDNWSSPDPSTLRLAVAATGAGTAYVDAVTLTRGPEQRGYADTGTGRWPSWVGNGGFDGGTEGWSTTYKNLVGNGNFEGGTAGWTGAGAITTAGGFGGSGSSLKLSIDGTYSLASSLTAGNTYRLSCWMRFESASGNATAKLQSPTNGTATVTKSIGTDWTLFTTTITPASTTSDWSVYLQSGALSYIYADAISVTRQDNTRGYLYYAPDTGPGGDPGGTSTYALSTAQVKYGARSLAVTTPASTANGVVYDLYHLGGNLGPFPYTASLWLHPGTANMTYKAGLATLLNTGTWEETTATGTATANAWKQVTLTRTPSAAYQSYDGRNVLYVTQTDTTARTFYLDGVRLIPGTAADDYELSSWAVASGADGTATYPQSVSLAGNAVSLLSSLNEISATRHWVEPGTASPYYAYTTLDRGTYAALGTAETFANDFVLLDAQELDRSAIVNVVPVGYGTSTTTVYYSSDATSVDRYGPRPAPTVDATGYLTTQAQAAERGAFTIAQYAAPRGRPVLQTVNRFPSALTREVGDRIVVTYPALDITSRSYTILALSGEVTSGGREWTLRYALEEYPY